MSGVLGSVFLLTLKRSLVCILHKQECQPWEPDGWSTSTWHGNDQWQAWLWSSHCNIALSPSASCGLRCLWDIKFRQNVFAHNTMTTPWEIKTRHKGTKAPTTERYECKRLTLILNVPRQIVNSTLCSSSKFGGRHATSSYVGQHDERQDFHSDVEMGMQGMWPPLNNAVWNCLFQRNSGPTTLETRKPQCMLFRFRATCT